MFSLFQSAVTKETESTESKQKSEAQKDPWEITRQRCPELLTKIKSSDIDWYRTNTRHHLSVFEKHNLPHDIKYVWSFFSGLSPEFLALEQYINKGFHYTAIDNSFSDIVSSDKELSGVSTSCSTEFLCIDLADWIKKDIKIDLNARHLLYFGHPYLLSDSSTTINRKQMIADTIMKFKSKGCNFDLYAGLYYEEEYQAFLDALESAGFPKKNLTTKEFQDFQVTATRIGLSCKEVIQPNRYTVVLHSLEPAADPSMLVTETGNGKASQYDYNENEKFDTAYLKKLQQDLKKYNLSLQCVRDFVLMIKIRQPLIQMQDLFKQLSTLQKYGLLNIHIDTGTDCLFEKNLQCYPPYGKALEVAKQYRCSKEIEAFLISEDPLNSSYSKGAMAGLFASKLGLVLGGYAGSFISRKDAASLSRATKIASESAQKEEALTATILHVPICIR